MRKGLALSAALLVGACRHLGDPEPSHARFEEPPADSLPPFCSMGDAREAAIALPIAHLLREPGAYVARTVRLRGQILFVFDQGYFLYADDQRVALQFVDPGGGRTAVRPAETSACGESPVDVEGTVRIDPSRSAVEIEVTSVRPSDGG
ncbi:MAG: hypothetical protein U0414_02770 [Polyangiaceae bacterium]